MSDPLENRTPLAWGRNDSLPGGRDNYPSPPPMLGDPVSGGSGTGPFPFDVTIAGSDLTVRSGTLNGLVPTNIGTTFTIPAGVTRYLVLTGTASDGVLASCALSLDSAAPATVGTSLGFPPNTFPVLLYVIVDRVAFRVIGNTSLIASVFEAFRVQKTMTTPDQLPYDSYYTWKLSDV